MQSAWTIQFTVYSVQCNVQKGVSVRCILQRTVCTELVNTIGSCRRKGEKVKNMCFIHNTTVYLATDKKSEIIKLVVCHSIETQSK